MDLFSYIIVLLISYILFYVFFINNILAISIIFIIYISILIDSSINIKDIIKFTKNKNQILDYFLIIFIGFLYILIVHLFEPVGDKDIEWITANRWLELPIDNEIPRRFVQVISKP